MPYSAMPREVEKWSVIRIRDRITTKLTGSCHWWAQVSMKLADYFCSNPADGHDTETQTGSM